MMLYLRFCLDLTLETWVKATIHVCTDSWLKPHPHISELSIVKVLNQWMPIQVILPTVPGMEPLQGERSVSEASLLKRELACLVTAKAFLHPSMSASMCCDMEGDTHPSPRPNPFCSLCEQSLSQQQSLHSTLRSAHVTKSGSNWPTIT